MSTTRTFSLDDICRAKTIPVKILDDTGTVEGIVYLKEPSAVEGAKFQESINADMPWHELVMDILALTLSDANGNAMVTSPADRKKLETMPPRMLITLRDPCLEMLNMSWSVKGSDKEGSKKEEIPTDGEDIDVTLANLDDQVAKTYIRSGDEWGQGLPDIPDEEAVPIEGNENLHLDQDPSDTTSSVDPTNPFVGTAEEPS